MYKVLFHVEHPYYIPSLKPLIEAFKEDSSFDLYYTAGKNQIRKFGLFLISKRKSLVEEIERFGLKTGNPGEGYDAVIAADPVPDPRVYGKTLLINVDHGPGFKTLRYRKLQKQKPTRYTLFVEGKYRDEMLRHYGIHEYCEIFQVGLHKLDYCFREGYYRRDEILDVLGFNGSKPVVLFAPSFKPTCIPHIGERIADLASDFHVIIKLHPYSWYGKYAPHWHHLLYERLVRKHPHIRLVPMEDHDIIPYLFVSDTIISEASSVINEFLIFKRAGVIFTLDTSNLFHSDGEPLLATDPATWCEGAYIHCNTVESLYEAVRMSLIYNDERRQHIQKWHNYVYAFADGKSSARIRETVKELLKTGGYENDPAHR